MWSTRSEAGEREEVGFGAEQARFTMAVLRKLPQQTDRRQRDERENREEHGREKKGQQRLSPVKLATARWREVLVLRD